MQSSSQITTVNIPALSFYRPDVLTDSEPSVKALKASCFYSTSTSLLLLLLLLLFLQPRVS